MRGHGQAGQDAPHRVAAMQVLAEAFPVPDIVSEFEIWIVPITRTTSPQSGHVIVSMSTQ
jgi:hypothetical protein